MRHWKRLLRKAVDAPSLEIFMDRLDGVLSNLVLWKVSLPLAGGLELDDLKGPSDPRRSVVLKKKIIIEDMQP